MLAANVIVADTDERGAQARHLAAASFIDGAFRRKRTLLQPPIDNIDDYWHPQEKAQLESMLSCSFIGSLETVQAQVTGFIAEHQPDELIVTTSTFDQQARLDSLERLASLTRMPPYALEPAAPSTPRSGRRCTSSSAGSSRTTSAPRPRTG